MATVEEPMIISSEGYISTPQGEDYCRESALPFTRCNASDGHMHIVMLAGRSELLVEISDLRSKLAERDAQIAEMWAQLCRAAGALAGPGGYTVGEFDTPSTVADHLIDAIGNLRNVLEDEEAMPPWRISFSDLIALQLLTHDKSVEYADYIERIATSGNQLAIEVKIADLHDNIDNRQRVEFSEPMESRKAREKRYRRALAMLLGTKETGLG